MNSQTELKDLPRPYLLFLGDVAEAAFAKTAFGLRDWVPEHCVGEFRLPDCTITTGLPQITPAEAHALGARSMVVGIASRGGGIAPSWIPALIEALEAHLDLVSGMHQSLGDIAPLADAARRMGRVLIDVRRPPATLPVATGERRRGKRLLTVGTDCALGKKYTALTLAREFSARGVDTDFRATGQTGILIAGRGIPIDAVVADFIAGAAETLSPAAENDDHWDVIEGQGALSHPSYAGVSCGLLLGSQPDVIVVCHDPSREAVLGLPNFAVPSLEDTIALNLQMARRTNPAVRCGGISLNTAALDSQQAARLIDEIEVRLGVACADPIRGGAALDRLVEECLQEPQGHRLAFRNAVA